LSSISSLLENKGLSERAAIVAFIRDEKSKREKSANYGQTDYMDGSVFSLAKIADEIERGEYLK
jgi:hypothetical protein